MSKRNTLGDSKAEIVEKNFLEQNPEGLPDASGLVQTTHIPEYKKVVFVNNRDTGIALHFHYHSKTHALKHYTLFHGYEHDLPLEVIEHLESCAETLYSYRKNAQGIPESFPTGKKYIFQFRSAGSKQTKMMV